MFYSVEEKLKAIRMVERGNSVRHVSDSLHLGHHQLYEWIASYRLKGVKGLEKTPVVRITYEKKCEIVREYQKSELSLPEIAAKYGVSTCAISKWVRKAANQGLQSLTSKRGGAKSKPTKCRHMKNVPNTDLEKENKRLREENERLKIEVLLLKKVKALVEEREARNRKIGRASSKS